MEAPVRVTARARLPRMRVAEAVADDLRDRILRGTSGDALPTQDQIAEEFGVSHPSVREAIRILETEGLVTVRRGRLGGAEVHRPDDASAAYHLGLALQGAGVTIADLAAGLQLLEPMCAADCARRPDRARAVVPALTANVDASEAVVGDGLAFTRTAREFHDLVVGCTPNATVRHVVSSLVALWSAQEQAWAEALTSRGEYPSDADAREVVRVHRGIVAAIDAGRADRAERLARAHLVATQSLLLEGLDDGVVNVTSAQARRAIRSGHSTRM